MVAWISQSFRSIGGKFEILVLTSAGTTTLRRMSKAGKLAAKILSGKSDKNFAFSDLCYILDRAGFQLRPGKGSHRIYYKKGIVEIINIQPRNRKAKPYQVKQVRELLLKYKIEVE